MTPTDPDAVARERAAVPRIEFYQNDFIQAFAAYAPDASGDLNRAFCVLNVAAFVGAVAEGQIPASELPYFVAETMMHEVIHVLEKWAAVEFSEDRVEALLEKYREHLERKL